MILAAAEFFSFWENALGIGRVEAFYIAAPVAVLFISL